MKAEFRSPQARNGNAAGLSDFAVVEIGSARFECESGKGCCTIAGQAEALPTRGWKLA